MAENLLIPGKTTKRDKYESILPQIEALTSTETDLIANLANMAAALKEAMGFFWVGFYLVSNDNELVLGPFQGSVACTRIRKGKGVCGVSWKIEEVLIVPDVDKFPDHIACSSASKSEIALPVYRDEKVIAILDVDSDNLNDFDETDREFLEKSVEFIN